ncbi:MAG: GGDEF domain-containing protein [Methylophilaceae bacterium]
MSEKSNHVLIEKIKLLYIQCIAPGFLNGVVAVFLVASLWDRAEHSRLLIWLGVTEAFAIGRVALLLRFKYLNPQGLDVLKWQKPYVISLFMVFIVWGFGLPLIIDTNDLSSLLMVTIFAIGIACAANSWYSALRHVQIGAISICLLPIIIVLFTHETREAFWIGIAGSSLFISCIATCLVLTKTLNNNLEYAYDIAIAKKQAELMASTDTLTNLNNRRAFFEKASTLLAYCRAEALPISVIMLDIDFFKRINDSYGHASGDRALQHVAHLIQRNLRGSDLACRFGGEEFAILLPNTSEEDAATAAHKIRQIIEDTPATLPGNIKLPISASFGVSGFGESLDELLHCADEAMYIVKSAGRNDVGIYKSSEQKKIAKNPTNKCPLARTSLLNLKKV